MTRRRRILIGSAAGALATALIVAAVGIWMLSPARLKPTLERKLSDRLGLDVTVETLSLSALPRPAVSGSRLVVRMPSRPDLPPFLTIQRFWADVGLLSAWRGHVDTVHVDGLEIAVPPGEARDNLRPAAGTGGGRAVVVDRMVAHDARLTILRRDPGKDALVFRIHDLEVSDVGFENPMPFSLSMTNPVPEGLVRATGRIGPWQRGEPAALPLSGDYSFSLANLGGIRGIGGTLTAEGGFDGRLTAIAVHGRTETPDFNLDLGGRPAPLSAEFQAIVNGSDGSVALERVDATLLDTPIRVAGTIENLPGPGRHSIALEAEVPGGRIEDILALAMDAPEPLLAGQVHLKSSIVLPPGPRKVRDRLQMAGTFMLDRGRFSDGDVEAKLRELSRRSQADRPRPGAAASSERMFTKMGGRFTLKSGSLALRNLTFSVPGALVTLNGTYALPTTEVAFAGTLRMDATVSQAVGGFKSIFLKPFDWVFRRDGAGAVVPIKITGTTNAPKMGIEFGKIFARGK